MGVVLELELLLLLARNGDPIVLVAGVQLAPGQLLRLESLLVPSAARRLSSLALTDSVLLRLFELAAIHVLRRVGGPGAIGHLLVRVVSALRLRWTPLFLRSDALLAFIILFVVVTCRRRPLLVIVI